MRQVNNKIAKRVVICLTITGIALCLSGYKYQQNQRRESVNWQHVSIALSEVETAKRELHQTLKKRLAEQPNQP